MNVKYWWWKLLSLVLILYAIVGGLLMPAPNDLGILKESIRNLHYHVPMWFTMIILNLLSYIYSIRFLRTNKLSDDNLASSFAIVGIVFGLLGIMTGSFWAKFTWTAWWTPDPKLNGAAIGMMIYLAYYILRNNVDEPIKRAKLSSVYNLFAFPIFIVLIIVLPKLADNSLHPGSGDSVGFNQYDLDSDLRKVFYFAVLGWILLGVWIANLRQRILNLYK